MADEVLNPNRQGPENYGNLSEAMSAMLRTAALDNETCLPCKVVSYDREANTAVVHPLIKVVLTNESVSRSEIGPIPVFALGSQQFVINFPLKPGDLGWMIANDRDITKFIESLSESEPDTYRVHDFNDAVFYPDMIRGYTIDSQDAESMVIQSKDSTMRISIGPERIMIKHPTTVVVDTPLVEFTGDGHMVGTLTADVDVIAAGISLVKHTHIAGGYKAGSTVVTGNSGAPA